MATNEVKNPFPTFLDIDGSPLENGFIYIGEAGLDPETNTKQVYWDEDLTDPITQPIITKSGYPVNGTIPARVYIDGSYSIVVKNKRDEKIADSVDAFVSDVIASGITIIDAGGYYTTDNVEGALQEAGASIASNASDISTLQSDKLAKSDPTVDAEVQTITLNSTPTPAEGRVRFNDGDSQFEGSTDGVNWSPLGSGLDAQGYNYDNKSFEVSIAGYETYKDTAQTEPEDGTGGIPVAITVEENTTTPLIGGRSLRIKKSAVDGQGEGVGFGASGGTQASPSPFFIDDGAKGRTCEIPFKYRTTTDYADGDIGVYLYDIDNDQPYLPSVVDVPATDGKILDFFATFIPPETGGNNYRLIFHVQSTNALAWDFDVDDIQVGKKQTVIGDGHEVLDTGWVTYADVRGLNNIFHSLDAGKDLSDYSVSITIRESAGTATYGVSAQAFDDDGTPTSATGISVVQDINNDLKLRTGEGGVKVINTAGESLLIGSGGADIRIVLTRIVKNINLTTDSTEYASNDSTTDADDTTSFVYGPGGSEGIIGNTALSTSRVKRIEFKNPIQSSDKVSIELYDPDTGIWVDSVLYKGNTVCNHFAYVTRAGGMSQTPIDLYHIDVLFYVSPAGSTPSWNDAAFAGVRWRVRKVSNGNMAEVPRMVRAEYYGQLDTAVGANTRYTTKVEDTHNAYDPDTGEFVAPYGNRCLIAASSRFSNTTTTWIDVFVNGVETRRLMADNVGGVKIAGATTIRLEAGDVVTVRLGGGNIDASTDRNITISFDFIGN